MYKLCSFLFLLLLTGPLSGYAQTDINSFNAVGGGFSTTYLNDYQCLGINPANLGWTKHSTTSNLTIYTLNLHIALHI
jgi:hypothetical protein